MKHTHALLGAAVLTAVLCAAASAEIIPIRQMELDGEATVTASTWDIGSKDALFDLNWTNVYRSAAINPAIITVEFTEAQTTGAARGMFSNTSTHDWTLEAADSVADLDAQTGTYVLIFGPTRVTGDGVIQWTEWNDAPVTRLVYRFTVYRVYGDNYVHIRELELQTPEPVEEVEIEGEMVRLNIIEIDPAANELPVGVVQQYVAEASLSYGPDVYDVADLADWTTDDPLVATVADGLVTAVGVGTTMIHADLGVVHADAEVSVRLARPVDLDVGFIHRTPEYNRFKVSFDGDQHIMPGYEDEQKWPTAGETVTYTAHVFNKGDAEAQNVAYRWYFDDELVDSGVIASLPRSESTTVSYSAPWPADTVQTVDIPPGAMTLQPKQLERAVGDHRIRIEVDPDDQIAEMCELNNSVEDYINAITFWLFMDETTYGYFNDHANFLESYSAEDWGRMQLLGFERRLRVAGCPQRLRLDMLAVYPDGGLSGGGTHEPIGSETRQADGRWGFQIGEWPEWNVIRLAKIVQNPLCHEWGHQIGLIDVYAYDIATGNCLITHDGALVAGTDLMPLVSPWNVYYGNFRVAHAYGDAYFDVTRRALMADTAKRYVSPGSAAGMNRNLGLRRGFYGDYLGAVQQGDIKLRVKHQSGARVANCVIRVFQRASNSLVPNVVKFAGVTNAQGEWLFPDYAEPGWEGGMAVNNPWSYQLNGVIYDAPAAVGWNAVLVIELEFDGVVEYHFVEVDDCNVAFAAGQIDDYVIELTTYESRKDNVLPVISLGGADVNTHLDEGEFFETIVSATDADGDPVTLTATALYNSTFDPATGRFTFRPDSLQVNRTSDWMEAMYVDFRADDGKFASVQRLNFHVWDVSESAYLDEIDSDGDYAGDIADPDDDNDGVDDADDLCPGTPPGMQVNAVGCIAGDIDGDADVDVDDLLRFLECLNGPGAPALGADPDHFARSDFDGDNDVDVGDLALFQAAFSAAQP